MAILKFLGAALYGIISSYIIWLLFYLLTPWVMSFGWGGVIVSVLCGSILAGVFLSICTLIFSPMLLMIDNTPSKIIPSIAMLFHGYSSVMLPWRLDMNYGTPKIILGITVTGVALVLFITAIQVIWANRKD